MTLVDDFFKIASCKAQMGTQFHSEMIFGIWECLNGNFFSYVPLLRKILSPSNNILSGQKGEGFGFHSQQQASNQLQLVSMEVHNLDLDPLAVDAWSYIWGSNVFSSKKAYSSSSC